MENFVVSARKYRPATFQSVVGQKHITSTLKNAIERGQLAHAYLFCGPRGVGKTTCARIFAKAINCQNPEGAEACNQCESCRSFNENRSLNIHELDAASNNSVDDIRTLIGQVRVLPQQGRYSVYIIDEVHMLSQAAFNAFLKTLEEPPAHAIFILATTEKHKIIPTILSRCQIYDFNRIRVEDSVEYLRYIASEEGVEADDESLNLISQKADGGMRDALSMFDKAVSFCGHSLNYHEVAKTLNVLDYDTYFSLTDELLAGSYREALLRFDEVLARGFSAQTFLSGLNRHLRDLLMARDRSTVHLIEMTGRLLERYGEQAAKCEVPFLFGAIALLTDMDTKFKQSSNQRLLVELGLMKIAGLGQKKNSAAPTLSAEEEPQLPSLPSVGVSPKPEAGPTPVVQPPVTTAEPRYERPAVQPTAPVEELQKSSVATAPVRAQSSPASSQKRSPLISISALIAGEDKVAEGEHPKASVPEVDPHAEERLKGAQSELLAFVKEIRPRFAAAFEQMTICGGEISVSVPTPELEDEILRSRTELLTRFKEIAHLQGGISLKVILDEELKATSPIRLEDRQTWLLEQNPLLKELRQRLKLESEI